MPTSTPVHRGQPLTPRELQIIEALADGYSSIGIGDLLGIPPLTVKSHLTRIGRKLGTGDRAGIVATAIRDGHISIGTRLAIRSRVPVVCACKRCAAELAAGVGMAARIAGLTLPAQAA
jgi:DNA-binding CsgD family transcriptional regulator